MKNTLLIAALALFACTENARTPEAPPAVEPVEPGEPAPVEPREQPLSFIVHEWGTFTSVQSSLGVTLEGLHHEEESLPAFVHGRAAIAEGHKQLESLPEPVTQKLETPVIYFHADASIPRARVTVDFPQGVIGQWFPKATRFAPEINAMQGIRDGSMDWDVEFLRTAPDLPPVDPHDVWAPSRNVEATPIAVDGEHERFIFYRGLGRFEMPLRVFTDADGVIRVRNDSDEAIGTYFVLHLHEGGGAITHGSIDPHGTAPLALPGTPKERSVDAYVADASAQIQRALEATGLYPDEARAMVDTWSRSYFRTPGLRMLYVVPPSWTDALLPLRIEPTPDAVVRTLVGRIEILTQQEEGGLVDALHAHVEEGAPLDLGHLGRFAEPKLRRALELIDDPAVADAARRLLEEATSMP